MIFIGIDIAKSSHFASAVNSDGEVLVKPFFISKCLILGNYTLVQEKDINIIKLRTLCRFRFDIIQSQTRLKT